ncbi:uncharacterized protein LOC114305890 [Camellia sinensis]|uniref:uncharacterized protein LOC114305890 n=1 Tax=Camellia sinensis TaxID=4442 RepID=UPI0010359E32|nr:uncharacterized protein LOC114305890 [Camellia sinensis]
MAKDAEQPMTEERLISEDREEKRAVKSEANSEEGPADKQPCLEESSVVVPFVIEPKIKNMPISSEASALKDPAVALSLAASVPLPANKATFRAEPDLVAIALAAQSALLTVRRITELGRRQHDAIERIGCLKWEVEGERSRAEFEAVRATIESTRAEAEKERARIANQLRSDAEERANSSEKSLKLAKEALARVEAELEELKKAKEKIDSEASAAFEGSKTVAEYDRAFTELARYAPHMVDNEYRKAHKAILAEANLNRSQSSGKNQKKRQTYDNCEEEADSNDAEEETKVDSPNNANLEGGTWPTCASCGKRHFGVCHRASGACFECGEMGHRVRDCPRVKARKDKKR